ncbi:unnamed protein product [Bursaphelenchus okinawaensis]|uniref:Replication factor C subunit 2 n=1 Tax=Bursaphelenchus okinawaensis TaxID=465554 RepID=A0A811L9P6_9BILA|nr:unnamed protein product [Bursaphelenchus okinawaensis]CAG9119061.1 unnamed protein product [Bursaphelenchus okinawaensis]
MADEVMEVDVKQSSKENIPWVEKYRPRTLDDVCCYPTSLKRFKYFAQHGNVPHLILAGPPGIGKTTTIHAMARDMLGPLYSKAVLELNASDERGIDVVRQRIKNFAETHVTLPAGKHKIIVLDEADSMTEGAQQALRRIMENYSNTTRFMLACNQSDKVIEPIQSRCAIVKYGRLNKELMLKGIKRVADAEKVQYTEDGLEAIYQTSCGDLRSAVNNLQCTASGYGRVTADVVYKVCDEPMPDDIVNFFQRCQTAQFKLAVQYLEKLRRDGYAFTDIVSVLSRTLMRVDIPEVLKYEYYKIIGLSHMDALKGNDGKLQLYSLAAQLCTATENINK